MVRPDPEVTDPAGAPPLVGPLGSVRVLVNPWVVPGDVLVIGDVPRPKGWEMMTHAERVQYMMAQGAVMVARDLTHVER
jgi:hypothetical protein